MQEVSIDNVEILTINDMIKMLCSNNFGNRFLIFSISFLIKKERIKAYAIWVFILKRRKVSHIDEYISFIFYLFISFFLICEI